jgi:hypothetical protein
MPIGAISLDMKWLGVGVFIAGATCTNAQTGEKIPEQAPPLKMEEIRELLNGNDGGVKKLAQSILGVADTNRYFYFPTHDQPATPAKWNFIYEDVDFKSKDGTNLHGWFLPAIGKADARGTVVFSHGNAGSIGHHIGFVMWLVEARYNVFMYDYRGFGKSDGEVDRHGMVEDVKAAFSYVAKRPGVDPKKLVSYGHSLGGAKSVTAIAESQMHGLKAVVIDGTFSSYQAMGRVVGGQLGADLITDEFSPKDFIGKIENTPILVIHGHRDEVVPFSQGKQLFDLANEPKTFFDVQEGHHGDSLSRDSGAYRKRMLAWLDGVM